MALKRFCDRCGAEITGCKHGELRLNYRKNVELYESLATGGDLCMKCCFELLKWIKDGGVKIDEEEEK